MIDGDLRTLHIRCGSDIRAVLATAGFGGDFLEYADPVCEGPVPDVADLIPIRARYLSAGPGKYMGLPQADCVARLRYAEEQLQAASGYDRVVLWFEHDSHDQLILARVLSALAATTLPAVLELICIDAHPDVPRFIGLGQLQPAALAALWSGRRAITAAQIALGQAIWAALRQRDPIQLAAIAASGTPALPTAARALRRHLQELPGAGDGLSQTQRIVLSILADGPERIGRIFAAMTNGREALMFLGDTGVLCTIERMARTQPPVLAIAPGSELFARIASITATGRQVLAQQVDYLSLQPPERWVGGVAVDGRWRWDEHAGIIRR